SCPPGPSDPPPPPGVRVRQNVAALTTAQLDSLRKGVAAMKALPDSDPRSWTFQAAIHGTDIPPTSPLFNKCEHGTVGFLPWHRGYLYYFERILRWAANDPALMLPYWEWGTAPTVPGAFRLPASATNPLYDATRTLNNGAALPNSVVVDGVNNALALTDFDSGVGFSGTLEGPHGAIHVITGGPGGNMSAVSRAARDPIFWLHHGNIDRLWDRWLNLGGGRANPSDPTFLDTQYSFADETGATVTTKVRDILSSATLGYRYDDTPNPAVAAAMALTTAAVAPPAATLAATSSAPAEALDKVEAKPLGFEVARVKLAPVPDARAALAQAFPATGGPRVLVAVEGVTADRPPGYAVGVYLNLPPDASAEERRRYYVGTLDFFGKTKADERAAHGHGGGGGFTQTFDATALAARLQGGKGWDPDALSVVFLPEAPTPPGAARDEVVVQARASAEAANVRYKRVAVRVLPARR
ncbi:MAG: tyrosinase family protein, partial [Gemmataceae bacterium]|nr:tyrosinase family protein [Gemmataceae bacterium]